MASRRDQQWEAKRLARLGAAAGALASSPPSHPAPAPAPPGRSSSLGADDLSRTLETLLEASPLTRRGTAPSSDIAGGEGAPRAAPSARVAPAPGPSHDSEASAAPADWPSAHRAVAAGAGREWAAALDAQVREREAAARERRRAELDAESRAASVTDMLAPHRLPGLGAGRVGGDRATHANTEAADARGAPAEVDGVPWPSARARPEARAATTAAAPTAWLERHGRQPDRGDSLGSGNGSAAAGAAVLIARGRVREASYAAELEQQMREAEAARHAARAADLDPRHVPTSRQSRREKVAALAAARPQPSPTHGRGMVAAAAAPASWAIPETNAAARGLHAAPWGQQAVGPPDAGPHLTPGRAHFGGPTEPWAAAVAPPRASYYVDARIPPHAYYEATPLPPWAPTGGSGGPGAPPPHGSDWPSQWAPQPGAQPRLQLPPPPPPPLPSNDVMGPGHWRPPYDAGAQPTNGARDAWPSVGAGSDGGVGGGALPLLPNQGRVHAAPTVAAAGGSDGRKAYAAFLEQQMATAASRRAAEKAAARRADAEAEREVAAYAAVLAARRAAGGGGDPIRGADGHVIASTRAVLRRRSLGSVGGGGDGGGGGRGRRSLPPLGAVDGAGGDSEGDNTVADGGLPSLPPLPPPAWLAQGDDNLVAAEVRARAQAESARDLGAQVAAKEARRRAATAAAANEDALEEARLERERAELRQRHDAEGRRDRSLDRPRGGGAAASERRSDVAHDRDVPDEMMREGGPGDARGGARDGGGGNGGGRGGGGERSSGGDGGGEGDAPTPAMARRRRIHEQLERARAAAAAAAVSGTAAAAPEAVAVLETSLHSDASRAPADIRLRGVTDGGPPSPALPGTRVSDARPGPASDNGDGGAAAHHGRAADGGDVRRTIPASTSTSPTLSSAKVAWRGAVGDDDPRRRSRNDGADVNSSVVPASLAVQRPARPDFGALPVPESHESPSPSPATRPSSRRRLVNHHSITRNNAAGAGDGQVTTSALSSAARAGSGPPIVGGRAPSPTSTRRPAPLPLEALAREHRHVATPQVLWAPVRADVAVVGERQKRRRRQSRRRVTPATAVALEIAGGVHGGPTTTRQERRVRARSVHEIDDGGYGADGFDAFRALLDFAGAAEACVSPLTGPRLSSAWSDGARRLVAESTLVPVRDAQATRHAVRLASGRADWTPRAGSRKQRRDNEGNHTVAQFARGSAGPGAAPTDVDIGRSAGDSDTSDAISRAVALVGEVDALLRLGTPYAVRRSPRI